MPTASKTSAQIATGKTILLVDDGMGNLDNPRGFGELLQAHFAVRVAKHGANALEVAGKLPRPDLILLDIMAPEMDGHEVLCQLRAAPETANIPVICLTTMTAEADKARGLALSDVEYIAKPVIPELLLARVRTKLELKEASDSLMDRYSVLAEEVARQVVDLKAAKAAAEASSQSKSLFINSMSHELQAPMHGVIGMLQLLDMEMPDEGLLKDYLKTAMESAWSMVYLIRNIREYTGSAQSEAALFEASFDLRTWLEDKAYSWRVKFQQKQLGFVTHVAANVPEQLVCDESRLKRILAILLDNALKFTSAGEAEVRVESTDATLHIRIRDTGVGIAAEVLERLFQPFEQGEAWIRRDFGGTGLGLAIAKRLAEHMGGDLRCISQVGKGSTFHLTLPMKSV